jgi:hypothetical protein
VHKAGMPRRSFPDANPARLDFTLISRNGEVETTLLGLQGIGHLIG